MSETDKDLDGRAVRPTTQSLEARDRRGYEQYAEDAAEIAFWEEVAAWPER